MDWLYLVLAGMAEIGFTTSMKLSDGFKRLLPTIAFGGCIVLSFVGLSKALETIPLGTAYAVWTGIGAVGTVLVGMTLFKEPADFWRLFFIALLIGSILGLKAVSH